MAVVVFAIVTGQPFNVAKKDVRGADVIFPRVPPHPGLASRLFAGHRLEGEGTIPRTETEKDR
jgi:hypothetical protein